MNHHWKADEAGYVLADSASKIVFTHPDLLGAVPPDVPVIEVAPGPPSGQHPGYEDWLAAQPPRTASAVPGAAMFYSSGTTGRPKGIEREPATPEMLARMLQIGTAALGMTSVRSTLVTAPLYHAAPAVQANTAMALGLDLTIMPRFHPEPLLLAVAQRIEDAGAKLGEPPR